MLKPIRKVQEFLVKSNEDEIQGHPYSLNHNHPLLDDMYEFLKPELKLYHENSLGNSLLTKVVKDRCKVRYRECSTNL